MYGLEDFVHLAIRKDKSGRWVQMMCLKATADFYGWSQVFPRLVDAKIADSATNSIPWPGKLNAKTYTGYRLRICRNKETLAGYPKGETNCFRVSRNVTNMDLYAIAQAVLVDYGWMNDKSYRRRKREDWLAVDLPDEYCHLDIRAANF